MVMLPYRTPWDYETKPFKIVDGVYYVGNKNVSVHLFDTGEGLLLLDTAYTETAYLLFDSIYRLGFNPRDVRWIVHSHCHYDHFGATRYFVEMCGAKTYMPKKDMPFMTDAVMNGCAGAGLRYEPPYDCYFDVDVQMCDGDVYTFGNITMRAYDAPGHTPGTMAYFFEMPNGMIVGMHGGVGFNTLTSDYAKEHNLGNSWREAYGNTIQKLRVFRTDVVLGNHPSLNQTFAKLSAMTADCNPFVDPDGWNKFLDWVEGKYRQVLQDDPL